MSLRIVIPVKPFAEAKQRLAPALNAEARARLAESMFRHVFDVATGFAGSHAVIVITRAPDIVRYAADNGAVGLSETGTPDLNSALLQAADFARATGASRLLIIASDLPLLCESDLEAMAAQSCAIAPDRRGQGTNALLWPLGPLPGFRFGEGSFARHRAAAKEAGLDPQTVFRPGLMHDIDLPCDLLHCPQTDPG